MWAPAVIGSKAPKDSSRSSSPVLAQLNKIIRSSLVINLTSIAHRVWLPVSTAAWAAALTKRDAALDAALYEALLRAGIFEETLHGLLTVNSDAIERQARSASKAMWKFLVSDCG